MDKYLEMVIVIVQMYSEIGISVQLRWMQSEIYDDLQLKDSQEVTRIARHAGVSSARLFRNIPEQATSRHAFEASQ